MARRAMVARPCPGNVTGRRVRPEARLGLLSAVTLAVTVRGRWVRTVACETSHKEDTMSAVATAPTTTTATTKIRITRDFDALDTERPAEREAAPTQSKIWALLAGFAYVGACIDPTGILAAQHIAAAREQAHRRRA
jgi:hypothetical protein